MRVAIYTRISTDEEHQPYSLEAQGVRLDSYIASQDGWEKVRTFTDQASGVSLERPALQRALAEAQAGRYDLLLVYRVDRMARSVRGLAHILEELDTAKVAFRSATEPFDTATPAGRMMVQMLGVFAEFGRATIVDRIVAGMERKAARGGWTVGGRPFGYSVDSQTGFLIPKPDEGSLVPVIFDLYANRRLGVRAIAAQLNEQGHRTKGGRRGAATPCSRCCATASTSARSSSAASTTRHRTRSHRQRSIRRGAGCASPARRGHLEARLQSV